MLSMKQTVAAWGREDFSSKLKSEFVNLDLGLLPLQQALTHASNVSDSPIEVIVIAYSASKDTITAKLGIFYSGLIAGCNCADDPTPVDETTEYCVLQLEINRLNAEASIHVVAE